MRAFKVTETCTENEYMVGLEDSIYQLIGKQSGSFNIVAARILGTTPFWPAHTCVPTPQPTSLSAIATLEPAANNAAKANFFNIDVNLQNHY